MAQNKPSDNNRFLNNEYRNEMSRDRTGSTGVRSPRGEYRNECEYDRLATSGRRDSTARNEVGSGTGSSVPIYRDRSEFEYIGSPGGSRSDTRRGRGSASDREIERHLSRTPRGRSPSLERGVRFQEDHRPQWSWATSPEYYRGYDAQERRGNYPRARQGRSVMTRWGRQIGPRGSLSPGESSDEEDASIPRCGSRRAPDFAYADDSGYGGMYGTPRGPNPYKMTNRAWPLFDPDKHRWDEFKARTVLKALRMGANERDVSPI
jgi:hypothetical protein